MLHLVNLSGVCFLGPMEGAGDEVRAAIAGELTFSSRLSVDSRVVDDVSPAPLKFAEKVIGMTFQPNEKIVSGVTL